MKYEIHDNYGRPYEVEIIDNQLILRKNVWINKDELEVEDYEDEIDGHKFIVRRMKNEDYKPEYKLVELETFKFEKCWIGCNSCFFYYLNTRWISIYV